jgi:transposase
MKRSRGSYAAASTPAVVKEYRAQLAFELKRRGVSLDVFLDDNATHFGVKLRTLQEHVKAIDERKAPLSAEKKSGRPAKLTDEQWDVIAGAILLEKKKPTYSGL